MSQIKSSRGMSLIEVLVAVLVLSIGVLGLAALQGFSLQSNQNAYYRTQATNFAYEVADFMRSDRSYVRNNGSIRHFDSVWRANAAEVLPGGDITIESLNTTTEEVTLKVSWVEQRTDDALKDGDESVVITTRF